MWRDTFLPLLVVHRRALPSTLGAVIAIVGTLLVALLATLLAATPTARSLATTIAEGSRLANWQLLLASSWALVPVILMIVAALAYLGCIFHFADRLLEHGRIEVRAVVRDVTRRLPGAAAVAAVSGLSIVVAIAFAPLISLVALVVLVDRRAIRRRWPSVNVPRRRRLGWFVIPFVAAGVITIRGAFALADVFLQGRPWPAAVQTARQAALPLKRSATVLVIAAVAGLTGTWAFIALGMIVGRPAVSAVLDVSASVVFAPLPIIAVVVMHRSVVGSGGPTQPGTTRGGGDRGALLPSVLSLALVATFVVPSSVPAAAQSLDETTATINTPAADATWTYGDAITVSGEVSADATTPTGTVRLWTQRGPDTSWGDAVEFASTSLDVGDNGAFSFDGATISARTGRIWVTYDGDDDHAESQSAYVEVTVDRRALIATTTIDPSYDSFDGMAQYEVGETVDVVTTLRADDNPDPMMVAGDPLTELAFSRQRSPGGGAQDIVESLGEETLVADGDDFRAVFEYTITDRTYTWSFPVSAPDGEANYVVYIIQETIIPRDEVAAAASTTSLLAADSVQYGEDISLHVEVNGPAGVTVAGRIDIEARQGSGAFSELTTGHSLRDGSVEVVYCASSDEVLCPDSGPPRLPFDTALDDPIDLRAVFRPAGGNDDTSALDGSTSAVHTLELGDSGIGACTEINLERRLQDRGDPDFDAFGNPEILTSENCDGGHLAGTSVALDAAPADGFELAFWTHNGVEIGDEEQFVYTLPVDPHEDDLLVETDIYAHYEATCHRIDVETTGSARLQFADVVENDLLFGFADCRHDDGTPGARHLSQVRVEVRGTTNPATDEPDRFYSVGELPDSAEVSTRPITVAGAVSDAVTLEFALEDDVVIPIEFGPTCRTVVTPTGMFGQAQLVTAPNCAMPAGRTGFTRNSDVTASAQFDPNGAAVFAGWRRDGAPVATAGVDEQWTFTIGAEASTTVEIDFTECHMIDVTEMVEQAPRGRANVAVTLWPQPNCFDDSQRWLDGTFITLRPSASSALFSGWVDEDGAQGQQVRGTVDAETGVRRVLLDAPLTTRAHFFAPDACSEIRLRGLIDHDDVHFPDSGCGPGYYRDEAKLQMARSNEPITRDDYMGLTFGISHDRTYPETLLTMELRTDDLLAATGWMSMRQEFDEGRAWNSGQVPFDCEPADVTEGDDGTVSKADVTRCHLMVRGDVTITLQQCQGLSPTVNITRADGESGRVFRPEDLGLDDHVWIAGTPSRGSSCAHPDATDQNLWNPDREVTLRTRAPAFGFEFLDWGQVDFDTGVELFIGEDPRDGWAPLGVNVQTNNDRPTIRAEVNYRAHCATLRLGHSVRIVDSPPNCPGNRPNELTYLVGSFVHVEAEPTYGGRNFERFRGVVANSVGLDEATGRPTALVLITDDNGVSAVYPDGMERFVSALGTVGKPLLGVVTLASIAGVSVACPPCGAALTALTASAFLLDLIPGIGGMATAALDLVNPLSILECTTKWGFGTTGSAEGTSTAEGVTAAGSTTIRSIRFAYEASTEGSERAVGTISARSTGRIAGSAAEFAYGLYEHRIDQIDLDHQTTEDLRDTATWNSCLNDKYRAAT